jgi:hypothetical protein
MGKARPSEEGRRKAIDRFTEAMGRFYEEMLILQSFSRMERILRTVMEELGPDDCARERLVEYEHWVRFFIESYEGMRKNWPKRDRGKTEVSHG